NSFLSQPRCILKRLLDIRTLQIRIVGKNLVRRRPVGYLTDDNRNRDAHPANAGPASHDLSVKGDAVKHSSYPCRGISFYPQFYHTSGNPLVAVRHQITSPHHTQSRTSAAPPPARDAAGLTLADVSTCCGIDQPAPSRLENGHTPNPTLDTL